MQKRTYVNQVLPSSHQKENRAKTWSFCWGTQKKLGFTWHWCLEAILTKILPNGGEWWWFISHGKKEKKSPTKQVQEIHGQDPPNKNPPKKQRIAWNCWLCLYRRKIVLECSGWYLQCPSVTGKIQRLIFRVKNHQNQLVYSLDIQSYLLRFGV